MEFLRLMRVGGVCISLHAEPKRLITIGSNKERVKNVLARLHGTQLGLYSVFSLFFLKPFPKLQILDSSKLKEFADDTFQNGKNGRKF